MLVVPFEVRVFTYTQYIDYTKYSILKFKRQWIGFHREGLVGIYPLSLLLRPTPGFSMVVAVGGGSQERYILLFNKSMAACTISTVRSYGL